MVRVFKSMDMSRPSPNITGRPERYTQMHFFLLDSNYQELIQFRELIRQTMTNNTNDTQVVVVAVVVAGFHQQKNNVQK
jgi:hypothetical protein